MNSSRRFFIRQMGGYLVCVLCFPKKDDVKNIQQIITRISPLSVKETIDRLVIFIEKNGSTVYSRINQQNEVRHAGLEMRPLEFILFGNPAIGGAIMAYNPIAALDLPLKIVAWEDQDQIVRVAFNDPVYIRNRYGLPDRLVTPLNLEAMVDKALT